MLFKDFINGVPSTGTYGIDDNRLFLNLVNQPVPRGPQLDLIMVGIPPDPGAVDMRIFKPSAQLRFKLRF